MIPCSERGRVPMFRWSCCVHLQGIMNGAVKGGINMFRGYKGAESMWASRKWGRIVALASRKGVRWCMSL